MILYQYCPQCKRPMSKDEEDRPHCSHCDITIYNNPAPTAGVLPIDGGKVLLARRAIEPHKGKLDTIGGFIMNKELPRDAALREAKEETGLDMELTEFIGYSTDIYTPGTYTLAMNYIGRIKPGQPEPKPADDVASLEWVDIMNPPDDIGFQNTRDVLAMLQRWYKQGTK
jgi:ADP-ribose pyrophosphatase YjhB (NUDIX family)